MAEQQDFRQRGNVVNLKEVQPLAEVDDVIAQEPGKVVVRDQQSGRFKSNKLEESFRVTSNNEKEMQKLVATLDDKILSLGMTVQRARKYEGFKENMFGLLGNVFKTAQVEADILRAERLKHLNTQQAVNEILRIVNFGIKQLGLSKAEYDAKKAQAEAAITMLLQKNAEATPKHLAAKAERQQLEGQVQALDDELKSGTIEPGERPEKEAKFEELKRKLDAVSSTERSEFTKAKQANDALPQRQRERDAAKEAIDSLHNMQLGLHEKYENYRSMLETAAVSIRAQARIGMYEGVDATFNVAAERVLENDVAVAGGALQTAAQRAKIMAVSAEASKRLRDKLREHLDEARASLDEDEKDFATGARAIVDKVPDAPTEGAGPGDAEDPNHLEDVK